MTSLQTSAGLPLLSREAQRKLRAILALQDEQGYASLRASSRVSRELINAGVVERILGSANRYYLTPTGLDILGEYAPK